jgi:hypothetical protein
MKGWTKFKTLIMDAAKKILEPSFENHSKELGEALKNSLFDMNGPTVVNKPLNKKEIFFGKIFHGFTEIFSSIQALKDIEIYISSSPYKNNKISKPRFLRYNIENYFNEMYLLRERLISFATIVGRCYKHDDRRIIISHKTNTLLEIVDDSLKNIIDLRGKHVHKRRFEAKNIERLELMNLLSSTEGKPFDKFLADYYKITFINTRNEWKKIINKNNNSLEKLMDIYSDTIMEILFDAGAGDIIFPIN